MSESRPVVSVLMTVYNREKQLGAAVDSVLASTFGDFELILVDDGSKDASVAIARDYERADSRVRVCQNEKNLGDYPNRNKAASYARGEYLKYVDADDYIYPWGLGLLVEMMGRFPNAGWGLCSLPQNIARPFPFELTPPEAYEYAYLGPGLFHKAPLSSIIRRAAFTDVGGFEPGRMVGDFELWHRLGQRYNVVLMPEGIVWYREHSDQEMAVYHKFAATYEAIKVRYLKSDRCPLARDKADALLRRYRWGLQKKLVKDVALARTSQLETHWACLKAHLGT